MMDFDTYQKISILGPDARYDTCGPKDFGETTAVPGVYHAKVAGNQVCRLFKVLQTNVCKNNCKYCAFRKDRDSVKRATATPDEMANAFDDVYSRRLVDGLFLSSGISGTADSSMTRMLDTAHILRDRKKYKGYMHLKIMPGSSPSTISEAVKLANRVSINIESPTPEDLAFLSPEKSLQSEFFFTLSQMKSEITKLKIMGARKVPSITTQFVVGAGEEKDFDLIKMTSKLYENFGMQRVFYSAFRPVSQTPLEDKPAESLTREHRLYQADWLMRFYRFKPTEIPLDNNGFLIESNDPKTLWAEMHPEKFPISLNNANYFQLLRIPGIGPESAKKIVNLRKFHPIHYFSEIMGMRLQLDKIMKWAII